MVKYNKLLMSTAPCETVPIITYMVYIILPDSTLLDSSNDSELDPINGISDYEFTDYNIPVRFFQTQELICWIYKYVSS